MYKASETMAPCSLEETLQRLNVSADTTFPASLFRSKASGKLLFLEAGKDCVEVLLSFLLLPVGTIIHMLTKGMQMKPVAFGISCIFGSLRNLSASDLQVANTHQTGPRPAAIGCSCRSSNLPMLSALEKATISPRPFGQRSGFFGGNYGNGSFGCQSSVATSKNTTFIVTDNLEIMPLTTNKNLNVLSKLNVHSFADLEGNDITVTLTHVL